MKYGEHTTTTFPHQSPPGNDDVIIQVLYNFEEVDFVGFFFLPASSSRVGFLSQQIQSESPMAAFFFVFLKSG